jgi:hypothetical protein
MSGDSEISPGGGVVRRPVPWLFIPGPVAGPKLASYPRLTGVVSE